MESNPQHSRRDFLIGKSAADTAQHLLDHAGMPAGEALSPIDPASRPYLTQFSRRAMACEFQVYFNAGQHARASQAALAALDLVDALEGQLTVYRDTSEIMRINREAGSRPVPVEPGLFELLQQALALHAATDGAFDITSGPLSKAWGFYRRAGSIPPPEALQAALELVGSQWVVADASQYTIEFNRPGVELNLNSIGKGYALDRCAELMQEAAVTNFLWHGGQSSVLARGAEAGRTADAPGWSIGVRHPLRPEKRLAEITLTDRALATSGASVQFFRHQGKRYGHILDPRTGWPAAGMFSSTVLAPTAAEADALATSFYVMGVDAAMEYCGRHPEIAAILLYPHARGDRVQLATANLADDDWRLLEAIS